MPDSSSSGRFRFSLFTRLLDLSPARCSRWQLDHDRPGVGAARFARVLGSRGCTADAEAIEAAAEKKAGAPAWSSGLRMSSASRDHQQMGTCDDVQDERDGPALDAAGADRHPDQGGQCAHSGIGEVCSMPAPSRRSRALCEPRDAAAPSRPQPHMAVVTGVWPVQRRGGRASAGRGDPVNLIRRGAGHGIGVEDRGDGLDSVDQAGSGTYHDGVSVDRPHRDAGKVPGC